MSSPSHTQAVAMGPSVDRDGMTAGSLRKFKPEEIAAAMAVVGRLAGLITERWQLREPGHAMMDLMATALGPDPDPTLRGMVIRCLYLEFADQPVKGSATVTMVRLLEAWESKIWRRAGHLRLGVDRTLERMGRVHATKMAVRAASGGRTPRRRKK